MFFFGREQIAAWSIDPDKASVVDLSDFESSLSSATGTAIGSVTFYDGDPVAVKVFLKDRTARILEANPWLGGKLEKRGKKVAIVYEPSNPHPACFEVGVLPELWGEAGHIDRLRSCHASLAPFVCREGSGTEDPLFRVSLLTPCPLTEGPKSFALVASVTHVVADGSTYYALYKMLDSEAAVVPLNATRAPDIDAREKELVGGLDSYPRCMVSMATNMLFRPKRPLVVYEVDVQLLNSQKASLAKEGGVEFVSANDILTAAFFKATKSDVSFMAINLRNRVAGYADDLAGNYESLVWYAPSDVSPALIRKSLTPRPGFCRAGEPQTEFPSFATRMRGRICNSTNWATFYGDVRLPGSEQTMHVPLIDWQTIVKLMDMCIMFRPAANRLAMACAIHAETQAAFEAEMQGALRVS